MVSKTSLTESVRNHRWREVEQDLAARPDLLEVRCDKGRGWLHLACMAPPADDPADSLRLAAILLDLGLGIDDAAFTEGAWQATPLWHAVSRDRNLALVEYLLKRGANPNFCLFAAAWNEDSAMIRLLLNHGANIEEGAERGDTPLLGAVAWSKFGPAETLLAGGANPDAIDVNGRTALHLMIRKASAPEYFEMFVRHGARGDIPDRDGNTAASLLGRKRDLSYREIAERLAG
ncbi:ankyrin repeat domain-containing protein [Sphingomonas koreensis]